ncbi:nucleotide pyrophosphohydrolase [Actinocorallia populi]|uniref:nucleotide pyrophosphohydrolase n=1 Tax=Actinocorallia populi TaxID=2079200 RepID=UPI000D08E184|nr:nucleotide pyrophosphohydrolase [Actinocorallia populi]
MATGLEELIGRLRQAVHERGWERFHTPKNLAMALAGEAGELLAEFQWLTPEESRRVMDAPEKAEAVRSELADVFSYLLELADVLGVDLVEAANAKADVVARRYAEGHYGK